MRVIAPGHGRNVGVSEALGGPEALYVVVSGGPGSGKSTLARRLAPALGLPLLAKDTLKEAMFEVLDVPDVEASRVLGRACVGALLAVARDCGHAVLDGAWHRTHAPSRLAGLGEGARIVEVFCRCAPEVMQQRFADRVGARAEGHFDSQRAPDEMWNPDTTEPVAGGWPVVEVDTTGDVDLAEVVDRVVEAFETVETMAAAARDQWVVWRQDEHGNRFEVTRRDSQEVAQKVADAMEATGHKQTFWVSPAQEQGAVQHV